MDPFDFLKKARFYGLREFREKLTDLLANPKDIAIISKQNQPAKAVLPYALFLEFLKLYASAEKEGRIDPDQKWFWSEGWQKRMRQAWKDVREGRVYHFNSMDEALKSLSGED